jgi:hypothetical protein
MHTPNPQHVIRELSRVLKTNGQLLAVEMDFKGYLIADGQAAAPQSVQLNPYIARGLPMLFQQAGLEPIDAFPNFIVSREPPTRERLQQALVPVRTLRPRWHDLARVELSEYVRQVERAVALQTNGDIATLLELAVLGRKP